MKIILVFFKKSYCVCDLNATTIIRISKSQYRKVHEIWMVVIIIHNYNIYLCLNKIFESCPLSISHILENTKYIISPNNTSTYIHYGIEKLPIIICHVDCDNGSLYRNFLTEVGFFIEFFAHMIKSWTYLFKI